MNTSAIKICNNTITSPYCAECYLIKVYIWYMQHHFTCFESLTLSFRVVDKVTSNIAKGIGAQQRCGEANNIQF
ncbi:unnamed protein product, partial [Dicrocoelium dendriticum]